MQVNLRNHLIYDTLFHLTDEEHTISMAELISVLEEHGFRADRRTVYTWINDFNREQERIIYVPAKRGYYLKHAFSAAEAGILTDLIADSPSLSEKVTAELTDRILSLLSDHRREVLGRKRAESEKTDNDMVPENIGTLLKAIENGDTVSFRYYDISLTKTRTYRHNSRLYKVVPYALIFRQGRYYCVCCSPQRRDFAAYRVDKIDHAEIIDEPYERIPFDLSAWLRTSFSMYKGDARTITVRFDRDMASQVYDRFGSNIMIRAVDEKTFTASLRTGISPTLISWLIQFHDRAIVLQPAELIDEILTVARTLINTYKEDEHEPDRTASDDH